ncbi:MAG: DUF885 domain-containing protein [Pseudomonadota bacterium]
MCNTKLTKILGLALALGASVASAAPPAAAPAAPQPAVTIPAPPARPATAVRPAVAASPASAAPAARAVAARPAAPVSAASKQLAEVVESYWQRHLQLNPIVATFLGDPRYNDRLPNDIAETHLADVLAMHREYLQRVEAIDPEALTGQDRLTWDIFRRDRQLAIEGMRFQSELMPVNQLYSTLQVVAQLGSGASAQPFQTVTDYENWLKRLDGFVVWIDQAIANMRYGADRGMTLPRVLAEKVVPQVAGLVSADPRKSLFWRPVAELPKGVPAAEHARLRAAYAEAIGKRLTPALARLRDFVRDEYVPRARTSVAWSDLPLGQQWYAYAAKVHTTTSLTPAQIHQIGLDEVARIGAEMDRVMRQVGFAGDRRAFLDSLRSDPRFYFATEDELLEGYRALRAQVRARLPEQFDLFPKADFEIRAVEPFRARTHPGAAYQPPSPDGKRPGIFYVNTHDLKSRPSYMMQSIYVHEAEPGHHFQIAIQQGLTGLPSFRRFGSETAYVEGWGLYAESLGPSLGLYTDPYDYFGALSAEIWRAARLVVDTGIHAKGWSRQQAIDYMLANSALGEADAVIEIDRYVAWPGQALAYKIGELKIRELRKRAQQQLGPRFDVRAFHREVLIDGSVPLDVLEAKIDRWIAREKAKPVVAPASTPGSAPAPAQGAATPKPPDARPER